jgi:hypothetical protein
VDDKGPNKRNDENAGTLRKARKESEKEMNNVVATVILIAVTVTVCLSVAFWMGNTMQTLVENNGTLRLTKAERFTDANNTFLRLELTVEKISMDARELTIKGVLIDNVTVKGEIYGNPLVLKGDTSLIIIYSPIESGEHILRLECKERSEDLLFSFSFL